LSGPLPPSLSVVAENGYLNVVDNFFDCPFPSYCDTGPHTFCGDCVSPLPQSQVESLSAFYKDTNGEEWTKSTNWLEGDPCTWYGVECGPAKPNTKQVISLSLNQNGLQGSFTLPSLSGLSLLSLSGNDFDPFPLPDLSDSPKLVSFSFFIFLS